ncbi:MAG: cytochrome ubiquinol oxidase subunit I [Candidatus Thermoplasmatota archaeon]|jgi:cytochrome d ubiquinol oxidase subunit I|nr:cytochrome ubiquinol oxidase subunit I [Candidatus Thermoplasmatota archaeon]MCL5681287.1 cytochrome ubiquinol oxidase subunit I [Candidatus Thermoplasmatota archaeon]
MDNLYWGLAGIALTFFAHYFFVTVVLGLTVLIPIYEIKGRISKDNDYIKFARRLTSYLIRVDLFAGVLATWLTVFLAGYWPSLLYIATNILFYPISVAVAGIMIAIVSMALYWYTWDRMGHNAHIVVGIFMMVGALMVAYGMTSIFATLDFPYGVTTEKVAGLTLFVASNQNPLNNPIFTPMALYTWFISIALSSFVVLAYASVKGRKENSSEFKKGIGIARLSTIIFSILSIIMFFATVKELQINSQYLYSQMSAKGYLIISTVLLIMGTLLGFATVFRKTRMISALVGGGVVYVFILFFEITLNISRYPYIIVTGSTGIQASEMVNPLFNIPVLLPDFAVLTLVLMLVTFLFTLYLSFIRFPVNSRSTPDDI